MIGGWATILWAMAAAPSGAEARDCAEEARAEAAADRLSDLPREIRDDLAILTLDGIRDRDSPLLRTDAPTEPERKDATARFARALRFGDSWLVQFEVALFAGVRTVGYVRRDGGRFERSPKIHFGGPACASIRAALAGVTNPGGF